MFDRADFSRDKHAASGIPLLIDKTDAIVNNETEHTIIFGETGSKKTRCCIRPLITMLAGARESMFVTDVEGELSSDPKMIGFLNEKGHNTVFIDFKNFDGDGYNIFEHAFRLYCAGKTDKAMAAVVSLVNALMTKYSADNDPIWHITAEEQLIPTIHILFEVCRNKPEYHKYINILTLSNFCNYNGTMLLKHIVETYWDDINNSSLSMLRGFYSIAAAEKMFSSVLGFTLSAFKDFLMQEKLLKMLSVSTFEVNDMYTKPTCVFLIIPDETSAYDEISGLLIDTFYCQLLDAFSDKYQNKQAPDCRINWVCDEFCNLRINDMKAKISASRSREMRWYLVCQSKTQLESVYREAASTIIGNCKNTLFLQSSDIEMLKYISEMCGKTCITDRDEDEPIISVERLKALKKTREHKEAVYFRDELKYLTLLADIDQYDFLNSYADYQIKNISKLSELTVESYMPLVFLHDLQNEVVPTPFLTETIKKEEEQPYVY